MGYQPSKLEVFGGLKEVTALIGGIDLAQQFSCGQRGIFRDRSRGAAGANHEERNSNDQICQDSPHR
jgi:hypothetical protein